LAVSPEPERRSRAASPQGKQREQVERGSKRELLAETNEPNITSELFNFCVAPTPQHSQQARP